MADSVPVLMKVTGLSFREPSDSQIGIMNINTCTRGVIVKLRIYSNQRRFEKSPIKEGQIV